MPISEIQPQVSRFPAQKLWKGFLLQPGASRKCRNAPQVVEKFHIIIDFHFDILHIQKLFLILFRHFSNDFNSYISS